MKPAHLRQFNITEVEFKRESRRLAVVRRYYLQLLTIEYCCMKFLLD